MDDIAKVSGEQRIPVILCPNCGEKDRIALTEVNKEINNDIQDIWTDFHGPPSIYVPSQTYSVELRGQCALCHTTFEFKVSWCVPVRKFIP
jgi:Zn ribbon nucleic-acid-binding protein